MMTKERLGQIKDLMRSGMLPEYPYPLVEELLAEVCRVQAENRALDGYLADEQAFRNLRRGEVPMADARDGGL